MKQCPKCNIEHNKSGIFCSRKCANSRSHSDEVKNKIRESIKTSEKFKKVQEQIAKKSSSIKKTCPICDSTFKVFQSSPDKIYCSRQCYLDDKECNYRAKSSGGYREGSGRAKTGYYKGIYCGSTYELCWVIYQTDHGAKFERFSGFLEYDNVRYYPDFSIDETIIEIKGYESQDSVDKKTRVAEYHGYSVIVLRKEQLQKEFEWVKNNYQYKNLYELYDDYKPEYVMTCVECGNKFSRNKKSKTDRVFCSRICGGKGRHKHL